MPFELKNLPSRPSAETRAALQLRAEVAERLEAVDETDAEVVRDAAASIAPRSGPK